MKTMLRPTWIIAILPLILVPLARAQKADTSRNVWEEEIRNFEREDSLHAPPQSAILFVGSSSIRMWTTLQQDFPGIPVINRGFGGSELGDALYFADRIILPYKPRMIVVYAGDNDVANGKIPEEILSTYKRLVSTIEHHLPNATIAFISVKPSLARWNLVALMKKANSLIQEYTKHDHRLAYIDIFHPMLGKHGKPRKELFAPDGLHLNRKGYELWTRVVKPFLK